MTTFKRLKPNELLEEMAQEFPGIVLDEYEVSGADLVEWLGRKLTELREGRLERLRALATETIAEWVAKEECLCEESENGICSDCGEEVDYVARNFRESPDR